MYLAFPFGEVGIRPAGKWVNVLPHATTSGPLSCWLAIFDSRLTVFTKLDCHDKPRFRIGLVIDANVTHIRRGSGHLGLKVAPMQRSWMEGVATLDFEDFDWVRLFCCLGQFVSFVFEEDVE